MKQKIHLNNKMVIALLDVLRRVDGAKVAVLALRGALKAAHRWLKATELGLVYVAAVLVLMMMLISVSEITLRKLTGYSIEGVFEGVELMLVVIVYLGLARAQHLGTHVRVELFIDHLPSKVRQALETCTMIMVLIFLSLAIWMTGKQAWASWLIKETTFLPAELPIWVARGCVTIGFFFLWLRILIQIGERIYNLLVASGEKSASI